MKGSIRFDNEINVEVDVDPSAASGSRLTSCKNLIDGQELGGGGGGSSDFGIAEVKIINNKANDVSCSNCPHAYPDDKEIAGGFSIEANGEATFNIITYFGKAYITALSSNGSDLTGDDISGVTGDIDNQSDEYEIYIIISGDGTITVS